MRARAFLIAVAALAVGTALGRLTAPVSLRDEKLASPLAAAGLFERAAYRRGVKRVALEVPDIVGAGMFDHACDTWDPPLLILP